MAFSLFRGFKALLTGEVVWRSASVCVPHAGTYEISVKETGRGRLVVFKNKVRSGEYDDQVFEPSVATALGEALIAGAKHAGFATPTPNGA